MKLHFHLLNLSFAVLFSVAANAQHENDNWYFGNYAALTFSSGSPVSLPNGSMYADEGCSSISDTSGNLLFYTNGQVVYNANHTAMPNGTALAGGTSSTQEALIVKDPGNADLYYIFTTDYQGNANGMCYSKVDMTLDGGLGDVTVLNTQLLPISDERLAAVQNAAGDGYWVLTHVQPNHYYAYPVTASGIGAPVVSDVGVVIGFSYPEIGHLKISPDGAHIAQCVMHEYAIEIADFDNATGVVSAPFGIYLPFTSENHMYAAEFSPSGNRLYFGNSDFSPSCIYQVDMTAGDSTAIINSMQLIYTNNTVGGAMQLAPDNKIYVCHNYQSYLGVINDPDSLGAACNYVHNGFTLNANCAYGLPNFVVNTYNTPDYLQPQASIEPLVTKICPDSCIAFGNNSTNASSFEWYFDGANPNFSSDEFPTNICYATSGNYDVTLIVHNGPYSDTATMTSLIEVYPAPNPNITQSNDTLSTLPVSGATYQWQLDNTDISGATNDFYVASANGVYTVIVTNGVGCTGSDESKYFGVDVQTITGENNFTIFPNPADESFTIRLGRNETAELKIYNTLGQLIKNDLVENQTIIDVTHFSSGVYYITLQSENDLVTKRLVITHR